MSHFAEINSDSIVQRVIVAEQDFINSGVVGDSLLWIQCSYNGDFRKQYAGVGYKYDKEYDVFVCPQPYPSWTLDSNHDWQPPTVRPTADGKMYTWDEPNTKWIEVSE